MFIIMRNNNNTFYKSAKETLKRSVFLFSSGKSASSSSRVVRNEIFVNSNAMNNFNNDRCFTTALNNATTKNASSESFLSPGSFPGAMKRLLFSSGRDSSFSWNALKKRGGTKHQLITAGARAIYANGRSTRENMDSNRARLSGVGRRVS